MEGTMVVLVGYSVLKKASQGKGQKGSAFSRHKGLLPAGHVHPPASKPELVDPVPTFDALKSLGRGGVTWDAINLNHLRNESPPHLATSQAPAPEASLSPYDVRMQKRLSIFDVVR
jgi:hypothetical protein